MISLKCLSYFATKKKQLEKKDCLNDSLSRPLFLFFFSSHFWLIQKHLFSFQEKNMQWIFLCNVMFNFFPLEKYISSNKTKTNIHMLSLKAFFKVCVFCPNSCISKFSSFPFNTEETLAPYSRKKKIKQFLCVDFEKSSLEPLPERMAFGVCWGIHWSAVSLWATLGLLSLLSSSCFSHLT